MAILIDPDDLNQGSSTAVSDAVFGTGTGADINITSAGGNLPALAVDEFFEVRDHSVAVNNGLYRVVTVTTSTQDYECDKVSGSAPQTASSEAITTLGATGASTEKSVFYDTAARLIWLLEQGNLTSDGITGQCVYSHAMISWKDDNFLIANAPMPMFTIDADAGKFLIGQDASGNNNGWNWEDDAGFSIRTRKLLRNAGWDEINSAGAITASYAGIGTLGAFEDVDNDYAYYHFGNNTRVDDTVAFTFPGPVNEAIKFYDASVTRAQTTPNGYDFTDGGASNDSIDRNDGGSFITDGYKVGGQIEVSNANTPANNGTYEILAISASSVEVATASLTADTDDNTATLAIDNSNRIALKLRVRDSDPKGKTFSQASLASGNYSALRSGFMTFPLANASDQKIDATDSDITSNSPYTGMSITYYATAQSLGGGGVLVGGPYNFGIVVDCNGGSAQEVYEFIQYQLRQATDIDADANEPNIGLMLDGLARFVGDSFEAGSVDGGLSFPVNPDGGGSGVFLSNLAATSKNSTTMFDNTGTVRGYPIGTPVTLDFNQTLIDDTVAKYVLFFDYTIRTAVADLVINSGTGADGTFTSAGSNLPSSLDNGVGAYVRISGLTGDDAAMNGIYQVTAMTSQASWDVTRYDGQTIVTTTSAAANLDEHAVDCPDAIIVDDDLGSDVSGLASADYQFTFDYSNNVQGGRSGGTDADVVCKAIGQETAQYAQSSIQTIESGVNLTVPVTAQIERNFNNPA